MAEKIKMKWAYVLTLVVIAVIAELLPMVVFIFATTYYQSSTNLCGLYIGTSVSCGAANTFCNAHYYIFPTQACLTTAPSCVAESSAASCDICGDCAGGADTCGTAACGTTYGCSTAGNVCNGQGKGAPYCVAKSGIGGTCYCDAQCSAGVCISNVCTTGLTYSSNSTNSTIAGTNIQHNLRWSSSLGVSGYIFSFCNGTYPIQTYNWTSTDQEAGTQSFNGTYTTTTYGTGWLNPSSSIALTAVGWSNQANAYTLGGGTIATSNGASTNQSAFYNYNSSPTMIPSTAIIVGIQVRTNASCSATTGTNTITIRLSNNSGTSYLGTIYTPVDDYGTSYLDITNGSISDLWGLVWTPTNANGIRVNVTGVSSGATRIMQLDWVGINITYSNTIYNREVNGSWVQYTGIAGNDYDNVDLVKTIVTISNYTPSASNTTYNNNNRPDVEVGIWNGSVYINNSLCSINNTMGNNLPNNTAWNCTISTTDVATRNAWKTVANRKAQIRGVWLDTNNSFIDEVNVTGVYGYVDAWNGTNSLCANANAVLTNDTWTAFTSGMCATPYTDCWSNVTKLVNSTIGAFIKWCVSVNDTGNSWNYSSCSTPFNYTTTLQPPSDPPAVEVQQSVNITSYNSTDVNYSLSIWIYNHYGSTQNVNVTIDSNWASPNWYVISNLANNATNLTTFYNLYIRTNADTTYSISAPSINISGYQNSSSLLIYVPTTTSCYNNVCLFDLNIIYANGTGMQDANVTARNSTNDVKFSVLTFNNGTIDQQQLNDTENPYRFIISKSDYQTQNFLANITKKTDWTIAMQPEVARPQIRQWANVTYSNITNITYGLSIWAYNGFSYPSDFNVSPDASWGVDYTITSLAVNSSNTSYFTRTFARNASDYNMTINAPLLNTTTVGNSLILPINRASQEWFEPQIRQWINVTDYNLTDITYNLSVWVYNGYSFASDFNVSPDSTWGADYIITALASNSSNTTTFTRSFIRPSYVNNNESNITANASILNSTWYSNIVQVLLPLDPPTKAPNPPFQGGISGGGGSTTVPIPSLMNITLPEIKIPPSLVSVLRSGYPLILMAGLVVFLVYRRKKQEEAILMLSKEEEEKKRPPHAGS